MHYSNILIAIIGAGAMIVHAASSPASLPPPVVTLCTKIGWSGICTALLVNTTFDDSRPTSNANGSIVNVQGNLCYNLQKPFVGNLSGFSVSNGTACYLNRNRNCSDICMSPEGCDEIVQYPGYANLTEYGYPPWRNEVRSFSCSPVFSS